MIFLRTLLEIGPNENGGYVDEEKYKYRKNKALPESLLAMMEKLRMVPYFVRELIDEITLITVSF